MAKMTLAELTSAMKTLVDGEKQATGKVTTSKDNLLKAIDKIGKTIQINGDYNDKLPELDGEALPAGKTIEEYFIDLTMPTTYSDITTEGAKDDVPSLPSVEDCTYSYTLGRQKIKTTVPYDNLERAFSSAEGAGAAIADIAYKLQASVNMVRYQMKKQLLGNAVQKAFFNSTGDNDCNITITKPTDTATAEAFIEQIKKDVETASFAHEGGIGGNDSPRLIGAAPELTLFVKKGIMPTLAVKAMAGAFNSGELAIPATIKVVDDFGSIMYADEENESNVYAILADPRGLKLHNTYMATRSKENADGDFVNYVRHFEDTAFISKSTYFKVYHHVSL